MFKPRLEAGQTDIDASVDGVVIAYYGTRYYTCVRNLLWVVCDEVIYKSFRCLCNACWMRHYLRLSKDVMDGLVPFCKVVERTKHVDIDITNKD